MSDWDLHNVHPPVIEPPDDVKARAVVVVCGHARDWVEATHVLTMLGLDPQIARTR